MVQGLPPRTFFAGLVFAAGIGRKNWTMRCPQAQRSAPGCLAPEFGPRKDSLVRDTGGEAPENDRRRTVMAFCCPSPLPRLPRSPESPLLVTWWLCGLAMCLIPGRPSPPRAVSSSQAVAVLEQRRQQMIVLSAASHSMHLVGAPKVAAQPLQGAGGTSGGAAGGTVAGPAAAPPDPGTAQSIAYNMLSSFGWSPSTYFSCLNNIYTRESGWRYDAENASGAYGIPQALPGGQDGLCGRGLDDESGHPDQVGTGLYPVPLWRPLQRLVVLGSARLLLK